MLLLDFLATFNDESVSLPESQRRPGVPADFRGRAGAVVISAKPVPSVTPRGTVQEQLFSIGSWELCRMRCVGSRRLVGKGITRQSGA